MTLPFLVKWSTNCWTTFAKKVMRHPLYSKVSALYRGISSPLAGVAAINAIGFGVYGNVLRRLSDQDSISSVTMAGTAAGLMQVRSTRGISRLSPTKGQRVNRTGLCEARNATVERKCFSSNSTTHAYCKRTVECRHEGMSDSW